MATPSPAPAGGPHRSPLESVDVAGLATAVVGAACVLLSFTVFTWYGSSGSDKVDSASTSGLTFATLHTATSAFAAPGLTKAYFGWLSWLLLLVVVLAGLTSAAAGPRGGLIGFLGCIAGCAGAVVTYLALSKLFTALHGRGGTDTGVFEHAQLGLYLALAGYLIAGVGAAKSAKITG